jgi:hypothetical protein
MLSATEAIRQVLTSEKFKTMTPEVINSGWCSDFARIVNELLHGRGTMVWSCDLDLEE